MEIERRFFVKDVEKVKELINKYKNTKKKIIQDYIYSDIFTAIRKRIIIKNGEEKYFYTVKTGRKGLSVNEFEEEISKEKYDLLKKDSNRITIEKDRYNIPYIDDLIIELDVFHGAYEKTIFAEIEFKTEEQAKNVQIPEWFDVEIGKIISNDKMSRKLVDIESIINKAVNYNKNIDIV